MMSSIPNRSSIVVAMSGGVDSSVAAAILVNQGHQVTGMMLRLWTEDGQEAFNRCCTPEAIGIARQVAGHLGIPFYVLDVREKFRSTVVQTFIDGYAKGITPNPCLVCNRQIRFGFLLEHALAMGADFLATGHYARLLARADGLSVDLFRAKDHNKDQSYVLSGLDQSQLQKACFPLGDFTKPEVRSLATDFGLPVADRGESQDLCFITDGDYRDFLRRHAPHTENPGPILNRKDEALGQHAGLAFYTIGQRKGLGLSAPEPYYVIEKDIKRNVLIVGTRNELGNTLLLTREFNWISGEPLPGPFRAEVKIRYRARLAAARIVPLNGETMAVQFDEPLLDITPGQIAAFYDGDRCLGGGLIAPYDEG